jgi:hypothetical protein
LTSFWVSHKLGLLFSLFEQAREELKAPSILPLGELEGQLLVNRLAGAYTHGLCITNEKGQRLPVTQ